MKEGREERPLSIKACPFCGSGDISIFEVLFDAHTFICNECGAMVSFGVDLTIEESAMRWNRRNNV